MLQIKRTDCMTYTKELFLINAMENLKKKKKKAILINSVSCKCALGSKLFMS